MRFGFGFLQFGMWLYEANFAVLCFVIYLLKPSYAEPLAVAGAAGIAVMELVVFLIGDLPFEDVARALFG